MGAKCFKNRNKDERSQNYQQNFNSSGAGQAGLGQLRLAAPAPFWKSKAYYNGEIKEVSLTDFKGKYLVFFFYPMDFTFVCPTEIQAFSQEVDKFRNINCEVVAASTDSVYCHFAWSTKPISQGGLGPVKFPLLADKNCKIAEMYGVLKEDGATFRGLFIIDDKQNLRQITINDEQVGRSVDEAFRLVQAFQFADVHGEVCPVNWKPGEKGLKTDLIVPTRFTGEEPPFVHQRRKSEKFTVLQKH